MTTNKPRVVCHEVKAVGAPVTLKFIVREDVADEYMSTLSECHPVVSSSPLIRLSDYKALQAECEKLRTILSETAAAVGAHADPGCSLEFMSEVPKEVESVAGKLRAAIRRLCNIYVVDDYYGGQMREDRLDEAVNRAINAAMQEETK